MQSGTQKKSTSSWYPVFKPAMRLRTHENPTTPKPSQDDTWQVQNFLTDDKKMVQ